MTRALIMAVLIIVATSCAGHPTPNLQPPTINRYVFVETLPPETELCVHRDPFREDLACITLGEFKQIVRGFRRASLP